ncbi:DNA repair protein RecN (Recombination protein N) [Luteimonas sp. J16]|uniref:DNA repair protein RecN n=1 Tax=Luteimonas sp. J16 TaxID=935283 RepID=UPI0011A055EA|nr:DNA repair protein RecN [Luteimonas sp. J16]TWG91804.1 DNA repair protein RecN (Recombination protein N) [Luteimonas sp. J16]
MLRRLTLRDFAVVPASELEFGPGMTVISGETGAGKSLLVDALGFLSGLRADAGVVRHGAGRAELHAEFDTADAPQALAWLREQEFDEGEACTLRRTLRADGGSRAWINGRPATLAQLSQLAGLLVEIHGQHEHQALLEKSSQLALLDAFGGHAAELAAVRAAAARWSALEREREALSRTGDVSERLAWLDHQIGELEREDLRPEAIESLVAGHRRLANAAGLIAACDGALAALAGDDGPSVLQGLEQLRGGLARERAHEPRLDEVDALLDSAAIQIGEAGLLLQRIRDDLDLDPSRFEELDATLGRLHDLARKHRVALEELEGRREAFEAERDALLDAGSRLQRLDEEIAAAAKAWRDAADALGRARAAAAERLSAATTALIAELGMGGGRFEVALEPLGRDRPDPQGGERVEFLVSANAGQLSRISLAIEVAALGSDAVPTMVFDEVDSGIGGAVAEIVGQKLRALGASRQVLCVTHLPQVAAQGHAHYRVRKSERDGATHSTVELLGPKQRQEELARMLGGVEVSREARAAARRLLAAHEA